MVLAASLTGAFAAPAPAAPAINQDEAISRLEAYMKASPFGHEAIAKGINDIVAASAGSESNVSAIYSSALDDAMEELGEDLYRVRVTLANVGANKGNDGAPKLLAVDVDHSSLSNVMTSFTTTEAVNNASIWRFNLNSDGLYTLASNVGQYLGHRNPDQPELGDVTEIIANPSMLYCYKFVISYDREKSAFTFVCNDEYLTMDADGKLVFTETASDYSFWTMARAYDKSMDLPKFSTDENPVYYLLSNSSAGFLTLRSGSTRMTCTKGRDEYSYWYFVDGGENKGTFILKNKKDNLVAVGNTANGFMDLTESTTPLTFLFFMLPDNESRGWSMTFRHHNLTSFNYNNQMTVGFFSRDNMIRGASPYYNMDNIDIFSWTFVDASGAEEEAFVEAKAEVIKMLSDYKGYSPWCTQFLENAIIQVSNIEIENYATIEEATAAVKQLGSDMVKEFYSRINVEARGANVKIYNIRRSQHADAQNLGWYLTAVEKDGATTLNTVVSPEYNDGFWSFEPNESNTYSFRIRNQKGVYLRNVSSGQTVTTTTDVSEAGNFWLYPYENYIRILNADGNTALNADTYGNDLVSYSYGDAGSTWAFEKVAIIDKEVGMPEISEGSERKLYIIRSAANPDDVLLFDRHTLGVVHGVVSADAYCYFTKANDGGDGVQIVSYRYDTRVCFRSSYFYCFNTGYDTDRNFNQYIVPNGIEDKPGFVISHTYPIEGNSCISRLSSDPKYPQLISLGSANDWEYTSWTFESVGEVDHEAIFDNNRKILVAEVESYIKAMPFARTMLEDLRTTLVEAKMTDFGTETPDAVYKLKSFYSDEILNVECELEMEPDGKWISIANVRRRGTAADGAYLVAANGYLNTVNKLSDAAVWQLEYVNNGRYRLHNANGLYMGALCERVPVTENKDEAGLYTLDLLNGYVSLVDRSNATERSLNVNQSNGDACVYSAADEGSRWILDLAVPTGLDQITAGGAGYEVEYYNLTGAKVSADNLTPGVYVRVRGSEAVKVIIR